jgi:hypothetical protein
VPLLRIGDNAPAAGQGAFARRGAIWSGFRR